MPTLSAGDLALLRGKNHRSQFYLTPCPATALWSARVAGSLDRGETAVTFDGGSGSNFAAVGAYQELWVGSAAGLYDVGRVRIRSVSSGDSGVTGTVTVAANSLVTTDNDFLTFIGWYLLKPVRPLIGGDGTFYKDTNVTYSDQNTQPPPVCIAGENRAGFIDATAGYFEIESQLPSSYAIANGATISSYAAALVYGAGTPTIAINAGSGVGTIRFPAAGIYWIKWTVTDSNGKSQDTYRWYYAHSPIINNANYPITDFSVNNLSIDYEGGGLSCGVQLHDDASLTDIPDHAPIILWADNWYDETKKNITYLPDESGTVINGYVRRDQFNSDLSEGKHTAVFEITTINGVSENKYNFSVSLEAAQTVDTWWKYESWLTPTRAVHHFFRWHSTLLQVADLIGLDDNTDGIAYAEFQDGTLLGMPNSFLRDRSIRASLICDAGGRVHVVEDVQLRADAERAGLGQVQVITNADKSGEIDFVREQENRTPFVHTSGFSFGGTFDVDGKPEANAICAIAPGDDPDEDGASPVSYGRQTFTGQTHANAIAGRVLADANNRLPEVRINFSGNYLGTLGPHLSEFWELTIASGDTVRQIAETHNLILRNVVATLSVAQGTVAATATFEAESLGQTGIATNCPTFPDLPGDDFTIPEIEDLPGALITAASVNYLPPQTKSWTVQTAEATEHLLADPFWTTRQGSFASADAILWRCGVGYIKRKVGSGAWTAVTPATDPPNTAGDSPAPTAATVTYVQGEGSYINESEFVFIARWQNAADEWRSWLVYTADDGTGWTWQSLSNSGGSDNVYQITGQLNSMTNNGNHIMPVTTTDYAVTWFTVTSGTVGRVHARIVRTGEVGTPSMSNTVDANANSDQATTAGSASAVGTMSSTRIIIVWIRASDLFLMVETYAYDDSTMALTLEERSAHDLGRNDGYAVDVVGCSSQKSLISVRGDSGSTPTQDSELYILTTDASGTSHSLGTALAYVSAGEAHSFLVKISALEIQVFWGDPSDSTLYGRRVDVNGSVPSFLGSAVTISTNVMTGTGGNRSSSPIIAAQVDGAACAVIYNSTSDGLGYIRLVSLAIASVGSAVQYSSVVWSSGRWLDYLAVSDDGSSLRVFYSKGTGSANLCYTVDISLSGVTLTPSAAVERDVLLTDTTLTYLNGGFYGAGKGLISSGEAVVFGGGFGSKVLGASISKGIGDTLYVTSWGDNEELTYRVYDMADLSLLASYSLGDCTEAELDAKTYYAHPLAVFGDDLFCWFYGRMQVPAIGEAQIIYTADLGVSLVAFETGWGSSHCGSLVDDFGLIYAGRVAGSQTKLYAGQWDGSLTVKSTLTFPAGINPFGMVYNWFDDSIYAAAASGNSLMVLRANSPFTSWTDVTYNHSTAAGINAILAL